MLVALFLLPTIFLPTETLIRDPLVEITPKIQDVNSQDNGVYRTSLQFTIHFTVTTHKKIDIAIPISTSYFWIEAPVTNFTAFSKLESLAFPPELSYRHVDKRDNLFINDRFLVFEIRPDNGQAEFSLFTATIFMQTITLGGLPDGDYFISMIEFYQVPLSGLAFANHGDFIHHTLRYNTIDHHVELLNVEQRRTWAINTMELYFFSTLTFMIVAGVVRREELSRWVFHSFSTNQTVSLYPDHQDHDRLR